MLTRPVPRTGEAIPVIGMGTSKTFDVGAGAAQREPLAEVLRLFFAAGGKLIDSSPMYGRAESVVGDLLGTRDQAFLATKVWTSGKEEGLKQMQQSFTRMRAGKVMDLMQVHNLVDWKTQLATLRAMKAEGKIRYLGVTHYQESAFDDLERIIQKEKLDFVQLPYSIGSRLAEKRLLPAAQEHQTAVLVMEPFESGALFARTKGKALPAFAAELGIESWAQYFLKWIIGHPAVTAPIPATSKPKHMADNLGAGLGALPDAAMRKKMIEHLGL